MSRSIVFKIIMGLILVGALLGAGLIGYQMGLTQGIATNLPADANGWQGFMPGAHWFGYNMHFGRPFGMFSPFGCLVPFGLLLLGLLALRGLFGWGRHWHHGPWNHGPWNHGPWGEGSPGPDLPPHFAEWHRRAHEQPPAAPEQ